VQAQEDLAGVVEICAEEAKHKRTEADRMLAESAKAEAEVARALSVQEKLSSLLS
jgi:hypothetical protein